MIPARLSLPVQSMTGYASSDLGSLNLELRTVNARFLDVQFRIADELRALEPLLREQIGARLVRGKVECRLSRVEGNAAAAPRLNPDALARLKTLSDAAREAFPEAAPLRLADLLRWPGVIAEEADEESLRAAATEVCRRALDDLVATRTREGAKLAVAIVERVRRMREQVEMIS